MKYNYRKLLISILMMTIIICANLSTFAHSGRTDSSGGHKDNKNASGLGSYHYHCGGYPAHLHTNGVCPYSSESGKSTFSSSKSSSSSNKSNLSSSSKGSSYSSSNTSSSSSTTTKLLKTSASNNVSKPNDSEESNPMVGILTVGLLGAGGYWGYKKYKNNKQ